MLFACSNHTRNSSIASARETDLEEGLSSVQTRERMKEITL